jgi:hypothetical protein
MENWNERVDGGLLQLLNTSRNPVLLLLYKHIWIMFVNMIYVAEFKQSSLALLSIIWPENQFMDVKCLSSRFRFL